MLTWLAWVVRAVVTLLAFGGCFLLSRAPDRPDPEQPVSGPAVSVERCQTCHARAGRRALRRRVSTRPRASAVGNATRREAIRTSPSRCGTPSAAGCHQPAYQQTLASQHFAGRAAARAGRRPGRADRAPRGGLHRHHGRRDGASWVTRPRATWAAACARRVTTTSIVSASPPCSGPTSASGVTRVSRGTSPFRRRTRTNRCTRCHVRAGTTESGQSINTHRFARPGARAGR